MELFPLIDGESIGHYTVNYDLTADEIVRIEREGYHDPGPHPTRDGVLLDSYPPDHLW